MSWHLNPGGVVAIAVILTGFLAALIWMECQKRRDEREVDEYEQWELARRTPGAAYAACDDHAEWVPALPTVPPHRCGELTRRRRERKRLHRELELMLCLAAANRPRDDA